MLVEHFVEVVGVMYHWEGTVINGDISKKKVKGLTRESFVVVKSGKQTVSPV